MFITLTAFAASVAVFLIARLHPLWPQRGRGCDAYFFLMCAQALRENPRLPVVLPPKYLAEPQEQWYPPLFPVFLALLQPSWLRANHWMINHLLDLGVAAGLFWLALPFVGELGAVAAVALYALQPALLQEFATLTSRPLGMLMQLAAIGAGYVCVADGSLTAGVIAAMAVAALVYTHKLSLQLIWFLFPFLALATGSWEWLAILGGGYGLAAAVWPGLFWKIQRAHWDIVRFWAREWPLLGAHPVRQSPIYGRGGASTAYYDGPLIRSPVAFLKTVLQINIFAVFLAFPLVFSMPAEALAAFFWWWAVGIYVWVGLTHFLPALRCLGLAQQYVKFGYVPVLSFAAIWLSEANGPLAFILATLCAALLARWYVLTARSLRSAPSVPHSSGIAELVSFVDAQDDPRLMVFPYHLYDELAYRSKAQVLWGTHGFGFDRVRPFFPVLNRSIEQLSEDFALTHIIIDRKYTGLDELGLRPNRIDCEVGSFYIVDTARNLRSHGSDAQEKLAKK